MTGHTSDWCTSLVITLNLSLSLSTCAVRSLILPELVSDSLDTVEEVAVLRADDLIGARSGGGGGTCGFAENALFGGRSHYVCNANTTTANTGKARR